MARTASRSLQLVGTVLSDIPVLFATLEAMSCLRVGLRVADDLTNVGSLMKKAIGLGLSVDQLKNPPIIGMSSSSTRAKDWDDVLTAHAEDSSARTWKVQDKRLGEWQFDMEDGGAVQAVCVTQCGNFGLVGSSTGEIRMFNMQSGKERKSFALSGPAPGNSKPKIIANTKPNKKTKAVKKTIESITGLVSDALNTTVIASTLEGKLYVSRVTPRELTPVL